MRCSIAFSVLMAAAFANASISTKRDDCQAQENACRIAQDANQATCSAQLVSCLGYNPYAGNTSAASSTSQDSESSCKAAADKCRVQPDNDHSTCLAELAACLKYDPYAKSATSLSSSPQGQSKNGPKANASAGSSKPAMPAPHTSGTIAIAQFWIISPVISFCFIALIMPLINLIPGI